MTEMNCSSVEVESKVEVKTKVCKKCGLEKWLKKFNTDKKCKDGYSNFCKECSDVVFVLDGKTVKICSKCKKTKLIDEYSKDNNQTSGLSCKCKDCAKIDNTDSYIKRKQDGRCFYCNEKVDLDGIACSKCSQEYAEKKRKHRKELQDSSICKECGKKPPVGSRLRCQECTNKVNERSLRHAEKYKGRGICVSCKGPNPTSKKRCPECLSKEVVKAKDRYEGKKDLGLCVVCDHPIKDQRSIFCEECRLKANSRQNEINKELRRIVIDGYGGVCFCCGEDRAPFLTLDHVNNDGAEDRRRNKRGCTSGNYYRKLIRDGFPIHLRLLCWNCNCGRYFGGNNGICPHESYGLENEWSYVI